MEVASVSACCFPPEWFTVERMAESKRTLDQELLTDIRDGVNRIEGRVAIAVLGAAEKISSAILHGAAMQAGASDRRTAAAGRQTDIFAEAAARNTDAVERQTRAVERQTMTMDEILDVIRRWGFGHQNGHDPAGDKS